jgi:nucleoside transporter
MSSNAELPFLKTRLSIMMFLEFFIWGAWFELCFGYLPSLGFNAEWQQPVILGAFNVASLVALFFSTQFVDRKFAAEKFLAVSQLIGGLAILGLFFIRKPEGDTPAAFWPFFLLMLLHSLFYVPTISITNSIAFANLKDPQREFGLIRVWGTIGWIVASWPFIFILVDWQHVPAVGSEIARVTATGTETVKVNTLVWLQEMFGHAKTDADFRDASRYIFLVAGIASLILAAFSLILPHTPPKPAGETGEKLAWLEALKLLRYPFVLVLFIVTFIDAAVHQSFFVWTERFLTGPVGIPSNLVTPVMKIGQIAEIVTMVFLGLVLKKLGWRWTMILGVLGHAARFAVFAFWPEKAPAVLINAVHGVCYAFFFATVYIFVDEFFPKDIRSSAQGLFNFLILGLGPFVANFIETRLGEKYAVGKSFNFHAIFLYSLGAALVAALILLLFFHPPPKKESPVPT